VPPLPAADPAEVTELFDQYRRMGELLHLVIADRTSDVYLGEVMVTVGEDRIGELGIGVVSGARHTGLATAAFQVFVSWTATALGLRRLQVLVAPENLSALRLAERTGFQREGVLRAYWEHDGANVDAIMLSMLPAEVARRPST